MFVGKLFIFVGFLFVFDVIEKIVSVFWKLFESDGGLFLIGYFLEVCDSCCIVWKKVVDLKLVYILYIVLDLDIDNEYFFRVIVFNKEGVGFFL